MEIAIEMVIGDHMKKILVAMGVAAFAFVGCVDDSSYSSGPDDDSSSSEKAVSSSSEIAETSFSFNPDEYRTCDKKYEGKFLLHQYDLWYYNDKSHEEVEKIVDEFYKCEKGKWSGPLDSAPENETGGDVIRVAPDDWECDAENEGVVKPWKFYVCSGARIWGYTPARYARCEQGDWVVCEAPSSSSFSALLSSSVTSESSSSVNDASSSSVKSESSSSKNEESSSSVKSSSSSSVILSASEESSSSVVESSSSVAESSSSEVTPQSSSSSADVQSSSSEPESSSSSSEDKVNCSALLEGETGWSWDVPKECRFNPDIDYGSMTDERDGKTYKTVKIGDQTWMAENLNYYDASDLNVKEKSWCFGKKDNGDSSTCDVAGRFYTWAAAIDSVKLANDADNPLECGYDKFCNLTGTVQGICPPGWHLPNNTEWQAFLMAVGGRSTAGKVLKSQTGWNDYKGTSGNGTDAFGFTALPAGFRFCDGGDFLAEGKYTYFWSSVEYERDRETNANNVYVYYYGDNANLYFYPKIYAFSVRCVKNE